MHTVRFDVVARETAGAGPEEEMLGKGECGEEGTRVSDIEGGRAPSQKEGGGEFECVWVVERKDKGWRRVKIEKSEEESEREREKESERARGRGRESESERERGREGTGGGS